jgi:hypothetical protein
LTTIFDPNLCQFNVIRSVASQEFLLTDQNK